MLVQRDIGRLAQYTAEMGASVDLLDLALRIPPWEPMHALTRDELKRTRLTTDELDAPVAATVATSSSPSPAVSQPTPRITNGVRTAAISEQRWALVDRSGVATLARRHPLTVEGEEIGGQPEAEDDGAEHVAGVGQHVMTLCKGATSLHRQLTFDQIYHNSCLTHATLRLSLV